MTTRAVVAVMALSAALGPRAFGEIAVVKTTDAEVDVGGMVQMLGFAQRLDDPYKDDNRLYLFMNRARLRFSGHYDEISFYTELGLGGEASIVAQTAVSLSLLDFYFNVPLAGGRTTYLKVGQFKVPYGREQLTYEGNLAFADRSINNLGFVVGRDVGAALVSHPGLLTLIGGVFTGGGRDVPPNHYLPEKLGIPLLVARVGVGNVDGDPFILRQDDQGVVVERRLRGAVFVNALYTKDSLIGHSTVLNVKLADVPLTGSQAIQELTPGATWFIRGQRLKLLADLPIILHDPVFTETNVGSYAATDLPDQATVLAAAGAPTGNTVGRQNVIEARLSLQAQV